MKLRKILAASMATTIAISSFMLPMTAEATYASPTEMIKEILYTACTGINIDEAWGTLEPLITVGENEIKLNGVSIGYWDSDTIYSDSSMSTVYAEQTGDGIECNKNFLSTILDGLNQNIVENYVPTTDDWSKIVHHYDVTLNNITIPADQWVELSNYGSAVDIADVKPVNISTLSGIDGSNITEVFNTDDYLGIAAYAIDNNGKLYVQQAITYVGVYMNQSRRNWGYANTTLDGRFKNKAGIAGGNEKSVTTYPFIKAGVVADSADLYGAIFVTDAMHSKVYSTCTNNGTYANAAKLVCVEEPSVYNTTEIADLKEYGLFYIKGSQLNIADINEAKTKHQALLNSYSTSKRVTGNTKINKRLAKLNSLEATDTVTVKTTGWYVNGNENIDSYVAVSTLTNPGSAEMLGTVEVEELRFKVIVPSVLPMSADPTGEVTAATNATIQNLSNATVKITDLAIAANAESGWTMVENPSKTRGDNEFSFSTSLTTGSTIAPGESLRFTYDADMSPAEEDVELVDMVTMTVTIDWGE